MLNSDETNRVKLIALIQHQSKLPQLIHGIHLEFHHLGFHHLGLCHLRFFLLSQTQYLSPIYSWTQTETQFYCLTSVMDINFLSVHPGAWCGSYQPQLIHGSHLEFCHLGFYHLWFCHRLTTLPIYSWTQCRLNFYCLTSVMDINFLSVHPWASYQERLGSFTPQQI